MVRCHMYCAEQIVVPSIFPDILKTFAKDAIRTQPYDLLRWSAAYFRCLSLGVPPPVKKRIEHKVCFGELTKGYLRILLDQVGKGFYVQRDVLQKKWEGLCLPEDELFQILSLCRMYNWNYIHWLKVFAVMVGTLNKSLPETIDMICDLLTDDVEGGSSPIPMWMLQICYTFIAELDCSEKQEFQDGRLVLSNGELEPEVIPPDKPKILSSVAFRDAIIDEWKKHLQDFSIKSQSSTTGTLECFSSTTECCSSSVSEKSSKISSSFKFVGDFNNPYEVIKKSNDFGSILVLLDEVNNEETYQYEGPGKITDKHFEHVRKRELQILEKRDQLFQAYNEQAQKILEDERIELLKEIGPPWSWLHHFASQNCRDKSYNFLEYESLSQISDESPIESSDESFDYDQERYIKPEKKEPTPAASEGENEEYQKLKAVESVIRELLDRIMAAEDKGSLSCPTDSSSVLSFMSDVQKAGGFDGDKTKRIIEFGPLKQYLEDAEEQGLEFKDMEDLYDFFVEECKKNEVCGHELAYNIFGEEVVMVEPEEEETPEVVESEEIKEDSPVVKEEPPEEIPITDSQPTLVEVEQPKIEVPTMDSIFTESGIEVVDKKILNRKISENMIIGLATEPVCATEEEVVKTESKMSVPETNAEQLSSECTDSYCTSGSTTLFSDGSSKISSFTDDSGRRKKKKCEMPPIVENPAPFECTIESLPGIGGPIPAQIIQEFLRYCKYRSRQQNGMIFPRNFREKECPHMIPKD